ncbi:MAG: DUF1624 domain-containing protein [Euryarchaeota archaeon]|nr:DUF1624 domain-containing protein [Euryarchaeota archaeon]
MNLNKRFWEIDSLRGLAIIMMIIYHFFYDLNYFNVYNFNLNSDFSWFFGRTIAIIFIFLVGTSLSLSYSRSRLSAKYTTEKDLFIKYLKRGLRIFSWGLLINLVSWIFIPGEFIAFGILHFIGISIILEYSAIKYTYKNYNYLNLCMAIIFIGIGLYLRNFTFDFSWLMWLGFIPYNIHTVDYFPLLPWLGVVSIGLFVGNILYKNYLRRFSLPDLSNLSIIRLFSFLGRNSLLIYLIHQPIIIIILYLLGVLKLNLG